MSVKKTKEDLGKIKTATMMRGLKGVCRKRLVLNRERDVDGLPARPMLRVERVNRVMGCYRDLNLSIQS